jgi:hypothetical protein
MSGVVEDEAFQLADVMPDRYAASVSPTTFKVDEFG